MVISKLLYLLTLGLCVFAGLGFVGLVVQENALGASLYANFATLGLVGFYVVCRCVEKVMQGDTAKEVRELRQQLERLAESAGKRGINI